MIRQITMVVVVPAAVAAMATIVVKTVTIIVVKTVTITVVNTVATITHIAITMAITRKKSQKGFMSA